MSMSSPRNYILRLGAITALSLVTTLVQAASPATLPVPQPEAWWMARHKEKLVQIRQSPVNLVFIGDSITQGWESTGRRVWEEFYAPRGAVNLGFNSDCTEHVLWRLTHGEVDNIAPRLVVLLIGTNNRTSRHESPDETSIGIRAIVDTLHARLPTAKLLVLGLLPRGDSPQDALRRHNARVNAQLHRYADGHSIFFLDLGDRFIDHQGRLRRHLMPDQLHPSEDGYRTWAEGMEPVLRRLLRGEVPRAGEQTTP